MTRKERKERAKKKIADYQSKIKQAFYHACTEVPEGKEDDPYEVEKLREVPRAQAAIMLMDCPQERNLIEQAYREFLEEIERISREIQ